MIHALYIYITLYIIYCIFDIKYSTLFTVYSIIYFPECVARVPVSLWGSGGWGRVRLDVAFVVATVRNRPQPSVRTPYGRAYGKFCRGGHSWRCPMCRCFVSRGRRGTSWHSDVFCNVSKIVLRGRRNTFATFSEDSVAGVAICEMCWKLTEASHETSILR